MSYLMGYDCNDCADRAIGSGARVRGAAAASGPKLAALVGVPTDVLLGVASPHPGKRGPTPKLLRQLERLSRLPEAQQQAVLAMLDGVLLQHA